MPGPKESKVECTVMFSHDSNPSVKTGGLQGMFHLFEHEYDAIFPTFWYGVIDIACTPDEMEPTRKAPSENVRIWILLADGRKGMARYVLAHVRTEHGDHNFRLAVVGISSLA